MVRYVGGIITTANTDPTSAASSGVWHIQEALTNTQGETWQKPASRGLFGIGIDAATYSTVMNKFNLKHQPIQQILEI